MAIQLSICTSCTFPSLKQINNSRYIGLRPSTPIRISGLTLNRRSQCHLGQQLGMFIIRRFVVLAATEGSAKSSKSDERIPSWAKPDSEEPPPWAREEGSGSSSQQAFEIPFYVYLLASAITAIAAIGSIFEYVNQKPVFGVLSSDNILYTPVLGFFAITGIPTSAFLWFKSVQTANKEAEEQDRRDGYR